MNPKQLFPMVVSADLAQTAAFYSQLGFAEVYTSSEYLQVRFGPKQGGEGSPELCFLAAGCEVFGAPLAPFAGAGLSVSIPTEDADALHNRYRSAGVEPLETPQDRKWGWRSFLVQDPNGVQLDFFHVLEPAASAAESAAQKASLVETGGGDATS